MLSLSLSLADSRARGEQDNRILGIPTDISEKTSKTIQVRARPCWLWCLSVIAKTRQHHHWGSLIKTEAMHEKSKYEPTTYNKHDKDSRVVGASIGILHHVATSAKEKTQHLRCLRPYRRCLSLSMSKALVWNRQRERASATAMRFCRTHSAVGVALRLRRWVAGGRRRRRRRRQQRSTWKLSDTDTDCGRRASSRFQWIIIIRY